ncbi:MAG: hypothetical protein H7A32_00605 [Deltaproteobacteria bacterium]|nr:hypothetical protein [Deltaproteobacteria bacterium]
MIPELLTKIRQNLENQDSITDSKTSSSPEAVSTKEDIQVSSAGLDLDLFTQVFEREYAHYRAVEQSPKEEVIEGLEPSKENSIKKLLSSEEVVDQISGLKRLDDYLASSSLDPYRAMSLIDQAYRVCLKLDANEKKAWLERAKDYLAQAQDICLSLEQNAQVKKTRATIQQRINYLDALIEHREATISWESAQEDVMSGYGIAEGGVLALGLYLARKEMTLSTIAGSLLASGGRYLLASASLNIIKREAEKGRLYDLEHKRSGQFPWSQWIADKAILPFEAAAYLYGGRFVQAAQRSTRVMGVGILGTTPLARQGWEARLSSGDWLRGGEKRDADLDSERAKIYLGYWVQGAKAYLAGRMLGFSTSLPGLKTVNISTPTSSSAAASQLPALRTTSSALVPRALADKSFLGLSEASAALMAWANPASLALPNRSLAAVTPENALAIPDSGSVTGPDGEPILNEGDSGESCEDWATQFFSERLGFDLNDHKSKGAVTNYVAQLCEKSLEEVKSDLQEVEVYQNAWANAVQRFVFKDQSSSQIKAFLAKDFVNGVPPYALEDFKYLVQAFERQAKIAQQLNQDFDLASSTQVVQGGLLNPHQVTYLLGWKHILNPKNEMRSLFYSCMGADISTPLIMSNASTIEGIDMRSFDARKFNTLVSRHWEKLEEIDWDKLPDPYHKKRIIEEDVRKIYGQDIRGNTAEVFLRLRSEEMFWSDEVMDFIGVEHAIALELKKMGVDPSTVRIEGGNLENSRDKKKKKEGSGKKQDSPAVHISFQWKHPEDSKVKNRRLTYHPQSSVAETLPRFIREGKSYNFVYQKSIPATSHDLEVLEGMTFYDVQLTKPRGYTLVGSVSGDLNYRQAARQRVRSVLSHVRSTPLETTPLYTSMVQANLKGILLEPEFLNHAEYGWRLVGGRRN